MKEPMKFHALNHCRDAAGHLDPRYAADLRARSRASVESTDGVAFLDANLAGDPLAEELGEAFVRTATGGDDSEDDDAAGLLHVVPLEMSVFIEPASEQDLAFDTDLASLGGVTREPLFRM